MLNLSEQTQNFCEEYSIKPNRSKGQNFLINESIYNRIIEAADLKKGDNILEVGPGLGFLTEKLAQKAKKVIAVELDDKLAEVLRIRLAEKNIKNVEIVNQNILKYKVNFKNYKIAANLPYNITSIFLREFLTTQNKPESMVLMLQKEVAERIIANPPNMSVLAISVQFYAKPEIVRLVDKKEFWPEPKVDSAIIKLIPRPAFGKFFATSLAERSEAGERWRGDGGEVEKDFFRLVKFGFSARRKMLKNNLAGGYKISRLEAQNLIQKAGLNSLARAQELSLENWLKLFEILEKDVL